MAAGGYLEVGGGAVGGAGLLGEGAPKTQGGEEATCLPYDRL